MSKFQQILSRLFAFLPTRLPVGDVQFQAWASSIFWIYGLEDKPSNRHALASLIMHLGPTTAYKPKRYFSFAVMKSLSNETAFETIQRLREEAKAYIAKHMASDMAKTEESEPVYAHTEQAIN